MPKASSAKLNRHFVLDRWLDILKDEPPRMVDAPILHHYTDAFGVHGVISSNCLWATATQFSNDLSEIEYAVSIAIEIIKEMWGSKKTMSPWEKVFAEHLTQLFRHSTTYFRPAIHCVLLRRWRLVKPMASVRTLEWIFVSVQASKSGR